MADIHDLMRVTGEGRQAVTSAVDRGDLPGYRVGPGRKIWIPDQALDDLEKGHWVPATVRTKMGLTTDHTRPPFLGTFTPRTEES